MGEKPHRNDFSPQQGSLETLVVQDHHAQDSALFVLPLLQGWLLCPEREASTAACQDSSASSDPGCSLVGVPGSWGSASSTEGPWRLQEMLCSSMP